MTWDEFCNGMKKTVDAATKKINQTADLATLQVKLSMAERKLNEAYAELGREAYRHFTSEESSPEAVIALCAPVDAAAKECEALKRQIEKLNAKDGAKKAASQADGQPKADAQTNDKTEAE